VTKHIDEDVAERYEEEQCWRVWFLRLENNLNDNDEDIHVFDDGSWSSRYDLASAAHYSRLKLPLASTFAVPIRAGVFTAISAWPFQEHIHLSRQLVLLSYGEDEKTVQGLQITVLWQSHIFVLLSDAIEKWNAFLLCRVISMCRGLAH